MRNVIAQGELLFVRVDKLPADAKPLPRDGERPLIVGHSETGHHHAIMDAHVAHYASSNPLLNYLVVDDRPTSVVHQRDFDTHDPAKLGAGVWEVHHQAVPTPEGWAPVVD